MRFGILVLAITILILILSAVAADLPPNLNDPAHETVRLRLLTSFQKALLAQHAAIEANQQFEQARADYGVLADQVAAELKLPKGTQFVIDASKGTITVQPPAAEEKKPAAAEGGKK